MHTESGNAASIQPYMAPSLKELLETPFGPYPERFILSDARKNYSKTNPLILNDLEIIMDRKISGWAYSR